MNLIYIFIETSVISTVLFLLLKHKAKLHIRHLYKDNIIIIFLTLIFIFLLHLYSKIPPLYIHIFLVPLIILLITIFIGLFRFYRDPERKIKVNYNQILCPADGQIIYIKNLNKNETPFSVKNHEVSKLEEITKTDLIDEPCYLIGIVMTIFDVHVNRSPINGKVILNKHIPGKFLSLKSGKSDTENERCSIVLENDNEKAGVVLIASKRVRRIISFVNEGENIKKGQRIGVIKYGSQVDLIIPQRYTLNIDLGDQVYAGKTIVALKD